MYKFLIFVAFVAFAQTGITPNYARNTCGSNVAGKVYLMSLGQVSYPACLELGETFKIEMKDGRATINVVTKPEIQVKGNNYFSFVQAPDGLSFQIMPNFGFGNVMKVETIDPPVPGTACGEQNPIAPYVFGKNSSVVFDDDFMYVCTPAKIWRKIELKEI